MKKLAMILIPLGIFLAHCKNDSDGKDPIIPDVTGVLEDEPIACSDCDFLISASDWKIDGTELGIQPGDIICLSGNYNDLTFVNIEGTKEDPVIIKNCDEKIAVIDPSGRPFGVKFQHSHDFKLLGNGGGGDYGIKISTDDGFFLTMQTYTTDFEVARVEIAGKSTARSGFAGIGIKTSPYEDCEVFTDDTKSAWVMRNIVVRNNYIHDTHGEGMYIGHGFYNGRTESQCGERTWSHSIKGLRVFGNLVENTGLDGIQIKNADEDVEVYNNVVNGYAKDDDTGAHDEGIYIGDGTTGKFYNNLIMDGGTGIFVHGMGNLDIYNNVIVDVYDYAFFAAGGPSVYRFPDGYFNIFNNTFHSKGTYAFAFFNGPEEREKGGIKRLKNNIFLAPNAEEFGRNGAELDSSNNIFTADVNFFQFVDLQGGDLNIKSGSPVIDAGIDLSEFGVVDDYRGVDRPQRSAYDLGAFELE